MLLGTLGASLLGNLVTGKGIARAGSGNKKGKGIVRTGAGRRSLNSPKIGLLMPRSLNSPKNRIFNAASSFNKL